MFRQEDIAEGILCDSEGKVESLRRKRVREDMQGSDNDGYYVEYQYAAGLF